MWYRKIRFWFTYLKLAMFLFAGLLAIGGIFYQLKNFWQDFPTKSELSFAGAMALVAALLMFFAAISLALTKENPRRARICAGLIFLLGIAIFELAVFCFCQIHGLWTQFWNVERYGSCLFLGLFLGIPMFFGLWITTLGFRILKSNI